MGRLRKKIYSTELGIDLQSGKETETALLQQSKSRKDVEKRLLEFKGIGPKTVEIFLRDLNIS